MQIRTSSPSTKTSDPDPTALGLVPKHTTDRNLCAFFPMRNLSCTESFNVLRRTLSCCSCCSRDNLPSLRNTIASVPRPLDDDALINSSSHSCRW